MLSRTAGAKSHDDDSQSRPLTRGCNTMDVTTANSSELAAASSAASPSLPTSVAVTDLPSDAADTLTRPNSKLPKPSIEDGEGAVKSGVLESRSPRERDRQRPTPRLPAPSESSSSCLGINEERHDIVGDITIPLRRPARQSRAPKSRMMSIF